MRTHTDRKKKALKGYDARNRIPDDFAVPSSRLNRCRTHTSSSVMHLQVAERKSQTDEKTAESSAAASGSKQTYSDDCKRPSAECPARNR